MVGTVGQNALWKPAVAQRSAVPATGCAAESELHLLYARSESIMSLIAAVDAKDAYTQRHSVNVSLFAVELARALSISGSLLDDISNAALLHDVGKIGVPDTILTKPGRLTAAEFDAIKCHSQIGATILQSIPSLRSLAPIVLHHHERYDGRGYPHGLSGEMIPLASRIIHVADAVDAMRSPRCYAQSHDVGYVVSELRRGPGRQFDPDVAEAAVRVLTAPSAGCQPLGAAAGWTCPSDYSDAAIAAVH